jgi:two-component system sensor histidine kinase CiaH
MIRSLRKKFILVSMCSTLIVLVVILGAINIISYHSTIKNTDAILQVLAENDGHFPMDNPARIPKDEGMMDAGGNEKKDFSPETRYETRFFTVVLDASGEAESTQLGQIASIQEEDALSYARLAYEKGSTHGFFGEYRYLLTRQEDTTTVVFVNIQRELQFFRLTLFICILVAVLGMLMVFFLVLFFSKIVFRPVAESFEKQKRFITDASHEIKTPLTIIDANTEVLEMEYGENEWTMSNRKQIQRLAELTGKMVALTRMDEEKPLGTKVEFSISDAAAETARPFQTLAKTQEKRMDIQILEGVSYYGDEKSIRQLITLLLDNAVKYSLSQSLITMVMTKKGKNIILTIENQAADIPTGRLDILFERFYRMDASRNSETGGSGIGLSVAKAVVQAHKGKIWAESRDGHSLSVTVIL